MLKLCGVSGVSATVDPKGPKGTQTASRNKMAPLNTYRLDSLQIVLGVELLGCRVREL